MKGIVKLEAGTHGFLSDDDGHRITYIALNASIVADFIKVVGTYARLESSGGDVEYFTRQAADLAHGFLGFSIEGGDFGAAQTTLRLGDSRFGPVRVLYRLGDVTPWGEWVDGPDGAGKLEIRERVVQPSA